MEAVDEHSPYRPQLQHYSTKLGAPDVHSSVKLFSEILTGTDLQDIEAALNSVGTAPTPEVVHEVLKLSYKNPTSAIEFFRWVGGFQKPSPYAWNLMVDLLGKNGLFEPMWDAIRSMKEENVLSMATFASVFGSYCSDGRFDEAVMSFDVMDKYGIQQDVVAVNSLLSAICRVDNQTMKALEFFERMKSKISPDADSYAILLEGWEKEGNAAQAKITFSEMVKQIGWSRDDIPAYDAFLNTLVRASKAGEAVKFLKVMKDKDCLPGSKFFSHILDVLSKQNDYVHAVPLWDIMISSGLLPNLTMYNMMIGLLCSKNDSDNAFRLLDEMVLYGAFPESSTYNMIFRSLIKNQKVSEAGKFFREMIKNESPPTYFDCAAAISMLMHGDDPEMAIEIWDYMLKTNELPLDESANALLNGLCNMRRFSEIKRFAEDMLDREINIYESTMAKLKNAFYKEGRSARDKFDRLSKRWKSS
ncbi:pentatricopeptide repeat-containing protein At1g77360, mitochondrial-like [Euphorbia lathyris]|uniref:pentatricopeptide repeat-containing protein At1g77360, mitochondrial-like n=1 Tax=Euphorbia lathyris TaxID=212925 RepID=UPI0033139E66